MNGVQTKTAKLAGLVIFGGLGAGLMLSMAVPTAMKFPVEKERESFGRLDAPVIGDTPVMFEAPPEDLQPVRWQSAADEYAYAGAMPEPDTYMSIEPLADYDDEPGEEYASTEAAEPERAEAQPATLDLGDAAASAAQAASEAAADVRAMERVIVASTD
jgi:hypothetical protein